MSDGRKKILIFGGTANQVPLIEAAKASGLEVVLCDWTTDNPGIALADRHHQVSTMDLPAVLEVARRERVDGVITNSEPAVFNAAAVADALHLVGNPPATIEALTSKFAFREAQAAAGLFAPRHFLCRSPAELLAAARALGGRFVVKPTFSSGSRGTALFDGFDEQALRQAFAVCAEFSRDGTCTAEDYVEMPSLATIEGDVFVCGETVLWDGLFQTVRSPDARFVPMTYSFPLELSAARQDRLRSSLRALFRQLGVVHGEFNVEAYFTDRDELFVIEVNARQGGYGIPGNIREQSGVDLTRLLVTTAVGDGSYLGELSETARTSRRLSYHLVFSRRRGVYAGLEVSREIADRVLRIEQLVERGSAVEPCRNGVGALARVCLEFPAADEQRRFERDAERLIRPLVEDAGTRREADGRQPN